MALQKPKTPNNACSRLGVRTALFGLFSGWKHFVLFWIIILTSLLMGGCVFRPLQSSEEKAAEVARTACTILHAKEIEPPNDIKAVLTTFEEAKRMLGYDIGQQPSITADSEVWFVRLTGIWQLTGGPVSAFEGTATPNSPAPTPELWNVCEVIIDPANNWHAFYVHQIWKPILP